MSKKIIFLPDKQVKPNHKQEHLKWAGKLITQESPDIVVDAGDHFDMPSLSTYDRGKKRAEGARYTRDIKAGNDALALMEENIKRFKGEKHFTLGNHEQRIMRHVEAFPELEGVLSYDDFDLTKYGWTVHPFLRPVKLNGVYFSHYFPKTAKGTVTANSSRIGAGSAELQIKANMCSCIAGHKQGFSYAEHPVGKVIHQSIIAGSFYQHDEHYLGFQGNDYWRGVLVLHFRNGRDPHFDIERWSMWRLKEKYG